MKRRLSVRLTCFFLAFLMLGVLMAVPAAAWEQPAHMEINEESVRKFTLTYANSAKYTNAEVDFDTVCYAPIVIGTGKVDYNQTWSYLSAADLIVHGGYSADESNLYVSVKHFYDPLALSGKNELTDQITAWGTVGYTAIPATEWALWNEENPYCLRAAMLNYKKSMEIPSNASVTALTTNGNFRDFAGEPTSVEDMRDMYLGKSIRGLGEVMHLMADMTQPAHVRNDSHPIYEIAEQTIDDFWAWFYARGSRLDTVNVSSASHVYDLMVSVATYTNSHFYSSDTIADIASGVKPNNWEYSYPLPNFSSLTLGTYKGGDAYFDTFNGVSIPIVSRTTSWTGSYSYAITSSLAREQAQVQLPLAVAANAQVMDLFFPTFKMDQIMQEVAPDDDMLEYAQAQGAQDLRQFEMAVRLDHVVSEDTLWTGEGLQINYSGPGKLWLTHNGRTEQLCDVEFLNGVLLSYTDPETGEQTEGNLVFYLPVGAEKQVYMTGPAVDYTVEYGDEIFVTVESGARTITSDTYVFEQEPPEIELTASTDTMLPGEKVTFSVEIENPPERYKLEWTFGDEDAEKGEEPVLNRKTTMTHVYEEGGDYTVTVRLIDLKRDISRCEDSVDVSSELGEMEGVWNITMLVQNENKLFRDFIVGFIKLLIRGIISPLSEALGGGPVDESAAENYTLIGTEIYYSVDLRQTQPDSGIFTGALTYEGSNTDYIEGSDEYVSLRMEIEDGYITFYAQGYDDNGNYVDIPYLEKGTMTSPGYITGQFDFSGLFSGEWAAWK